MSAIKDDNERAKAIAAFRKPARPVDGTLNSRTRAAGLVAATLGTEFLSTAELEHIAAVKADPSKATGPSTPPKASAGGNTKSVKEFVAELPEKAREAIYQELLETGDFLPAATASTESEDDWDFDDEPEETWG
jgi:hypothetical protein